MPTLINRPAPAPAPDAPSRPLLHLESREVPPGGLAYKITALAERAPGIAWVTGFNSTHDLAGEVNRRERANGLRPSTLEEIEDQICQRLPPGYCRDASNRTTTHPGNMALGLQEVTAGTRALLGWFLHGSVPVEEIQRRTAICNECPENRPISGCQGCAGQQLRSLMNTIVARPLPSDAVLHACYICKCSLKAKVRMQLSDLPPLTPDQRARLPEPCWLNDTVTDPST